jgi:hypothetical protein
MTFQTAESRTGESSLEDSPQAPEMTASVAKIRPSLPYLMGYRHHHLKEAGIEEPQTSAMILASTKARIPYNNGHGDFCFYPTFPVDSKYQSNNVPFKEKGGFTR